jgi:hypothetical protein
MEEIKEWLSSGTDYWQGVELFAKHSEDSFMLTQLRRANHTFNYNKLVKCLEALVKEPAPTPSAPPNPKPSKEDIPQAVLDMMDQRRVIHTELWHKSSEYERKVGCFRILSLSKKISNFYAGIAEEEPPEPEDLPEDRAHLIAKRNNNRAYISKNKDKANKTAEVNRRLEENKEIKSLINGNSEE